MKTLVTRNSQNPVIFITSNRNLRYIAELFPTDRQVHKAWVTRGNWKYGNSVFDVYWTGIEKKYYIYSPIRDSALLLRKYKRVWVT